MFIIQIFRGINKSEKQEFLSQIFFGKSFACSVKSFELCLHCGFIFRNSVPILLLGF
jgi:hypothetical protein